MQMRTTRGITLYWSERPPSKSPHTVNAGASMEERVPSYATSKNVNSYSHYGEQYGASLES